MTGERDMATSAGADAWWRGWRRRTKLRGHVTLGADVRFLGNPHVQNRGSLHLGSNVVVAAVPVRAHLVTGVRGTITLHDRVIVGHGVGVTALESVEVGEDTIIGPFTMIHDTEFHDLVDRKAPGAVTPIVIGRNVRIGPWVTILRGARIGDRAIVAAGSVVRGEIFAGAHVRGTPARPV
jgi:acetyltransferase-like isoleucine patch superfamily enzyme